MTSISLTCSGCKRKGMGEHRSVGTLNLQQGHYTLHCMGILPEHKVLYSCSMRKLLIKKGFCSAMKEI